MNGRFVQSAAVYGAVVSEIGQPRFSEALMKAVALSVAPIDHCSIFHFKQGKYVHHVGTASAVSLEKGVRSAERYACGLHAYDPMKEFMRIASGNDPVRLFRLTPERIREQCYRDSLAQLQTVERLSILTLAEESFYSLNLYRSRTSGRFSSRELSRLSDAAPLLGSLAKKHAEIVASCAADLGAGQIAEHLHDSHAGLSPREIEVCKLALLGYRSEAIAQTLGLRYSTVLTYRKRAYAKLGISSQNELFRLCLSKRVHIGSIIPA